VRFYVKIWAILVILLAVSIAGPTIGIFWVTMTTAFGVAIVKAYLVAANFMHLNIEKRLGSIIIFAALILMSLLFAGVAPDVMKHEGDQWVNAAARAETARRFEKEGEHGEKIKHHGAAAHEGATHAPKH
jgi:caa(3)-type oxidase subunit IV